LRWSRQAGEPGPRLDRSEQELDGNRRRNGSGRAAPEPAPSESRSEGIKKSRFVAGSARIAVLPAATAADLGNFVRGAAKPGARIITDGLKS
jgi:hypothetical protein